MDRKSSSTPRSEQSGNEQPPAAPKDLGQRLSEEINFDTGKLQDVSRSMRSNRSREYRLLAVVLILSWLPYLIALWWWPLHGLIVLLFLAYFQVIIAFAGSTSTDTAHAIRFLLSGSNPIGMTGCSSLILGAVDAIIDWREDAGERKRAPLRFWALCTYKVLMTPIGCVLMATEYLWDAVLLLRPTIIPLKWNELFSLAEFHDIICPEKSNDIFYADLAFARWKCDAMLYQWNRLRCMVFELEHYRIDVSNSVGVAETNLFLQSEIAAYQTLKRLKLERLETAIDKHNDATPDWLPFPKSIATRLVNNAQPIEHYLRMRESLLNHRTTRTPFDKALSQLLREEAEGKYRCWYVLRILDSLSGKEDERHLLVADASGYLTSNVLTDLQSVGVLERRSNGEVYVRNEFANQFQNLLEQHYEQPTTLHHHSLALRQVPDYFELRDRHFHSRLRGSEFVEL